MKKIFTASKNMKHEYCCVVVKIGEVIPVENTDHLGKTIVEGFSVVVDRRTIKEGDVLIYAENETALDLDFLAANNQFEEKDAYRNKNYAHYLELVQQDKREEARSICGFFNKCGRVKLITLRGCPSFGYLFSKDSLVRWKPELIDINLEDYIGQDFDTILGKKFVEEYIRETKVITYDKIPTRKKEKRNQKVQKRADKLKHMIKGEFIFHYETGQLERNMFKINPDDVINISVKMHGTSAIFANVKMRHPKLDMPNWKNIINKLAFNLHLKKPFKDYYVDYGKIFSSRRVIRNKEINDKNVDNFYSTDAYCEYGNIIKDYLNEGMTVYGEIVGYETGKNNKMFQTDFDYGCKPGTNFMMPYRITTSLENGGKYEWNVNEIVEWVNHLVTMNPSLKDRVRPMTILYRGKAANLYPDIRIDEKWHENVIQRMKEDKEILGMELKESLCNNEVPREGICIRIDNDIDPECFKLKTLKFRQYEKKKYDKGEVDDEAIEGHLEENGVEEC